jgi:uncharacterized RDD family membrane protein YckC
MELRSTHFFPRVCALVYDSMLVIALWFLATASLLPFTDGEAINHDNLFFPLYLAAWAYGYVVFSWRFGGRTLGMKAWRMQLIPQTGEQRGLSWRECIQYAAAATLSWLPLGGGFFMAIFRRDRHSLHEHLTGLMVYRHGKTDGR